MKFIFSGAIVTLSMILAFGIGSQLDWWMAPDCKAATKSLYCTIQDWQTLIASLLAIIAALMAARPVYQQLEEMRAQTRLQTYQVLRELSASIENERRIASEIDVATSVLKLVDGEWAKQANSREFIAIVIEQLQKCFNVLREHRDALNESGNKKWGNPVAVHTRAVFISALANLWLEISNKIASLTVLKGRIPPGLVGQQVSSEYANAIGSGFASLVQALRNAQTKFDEQAVAEIEKIKPELDQAVWRLTNRATN